jgi:aminoglycoside 6'-N-acetyltransferase I
VTRLRPLEDHDTPEWLRLRLALWPDAGLEEQEREMDAIRRDPERQAVFVFERSDGRLGGFVEASLHETAEGCTSSPVGYLEAWYVDPDVRRRGIGGQLVAAAETWARVAGCREMASDTSPEYPLGPVAHARLGYAPTSIRFRKSLPPLEDVGGREGVKSVR